MSELLTDEQLQILILQFGACRAAYGETGRFTKAEASELIDALQTITAINFLINLALKGAALIDWCNGEIILRDKDTTVELARKRIAK